MKRDDVAQRSAARDALLLQHAPAIRSLLALAPTDPIPAPPSALVQLLRTRHVALEAALREKTEKKSALQRAHADMQLQLQGTRAKVTAVQQELAALEGDLAQRMRNISASEGFYYYYHYLFFFN